MQIVLGQRRRAARAGVAVPRTAASGGLLSRFDERLPFELTPGQQEAGREIAADLACEQPMNRLLQGEVGSGKTLVALRAMLAVVDAGGQCALLAPTEVLAAQHHRSITGLLGDLAEAGLLGGDAGGTRVTLLTGSMSTAARKKAMLEAASGEAGIVVGTHSLIQDKVSFAALGLVVVDEQHRFGVEQRDALSDKATGQPHLLVMTATPIPRTVAMTVFGDMDVSTMRELPPGRAPIATHVVDNPRWYERAWSRVAEEVAAGHQAYVVCPRIDSGGQETDGADLLTGYDGDGDDADGFAAGEECALFGPEHTASARDPREEFVISDLSAVDDVAAEITARPEFAGVRVGVLHGRLPAEEKDAVMTAFAAGEIDVLVSTTVIEVGVDVPNATVMVVMNADRYGVSQLHQLRGRVGRGSAPGLCLLVTRTQVESAERRVRAVAELTDGFALADIDLAERREGDILGARQSGGRSTLRVLRLSHDAQIIDSARADAAALLDEDPSLDGHARLRDMVLRMVDDEAAEFLTRG
ncbi:ATP-dependent DNA helicase RecG [Mobilicoccus caccae]|nr:ATP-dependent DNA helicase RecG [Mobilicoccus caccae]